MTTVEVMSDRDVPEDALAPGADVVIWRYTENRSKGDVLIPLPCHKLEKVVWVPYLPATLDRQTVICRVCQRTWRMAMLDDNDGGWYAQFTHAPEPVLLSYHRHHA